MTTTSTGEADLTPDEADPTPDEADPTAEDQRDDGPVVDPRYLIAYSLGEPTLVLSPAPTRRAWMDETPQRFANRCLPMLIANQSGWCLTSVQSVRATWNGGVTKDDVTIEVLDGPSVPAVSSHFGSGVITWTVPFLFRTPPGWNLLVRGPANQPLDGAQALEGVVETDWSMSTFTMNWKLTRPGMPVTFEAGWPVCMVVPQRRAEFESFNPVLTRLDPATATFMEYHDWAAGRAAFLVGLDTPGSAEIAKGWQRDYFLGINQGQRTAGHQMKRDLKGFLGHAPHDRPPVDGPVEAPLDEAPVEGGPAGGR
jgi:hypothetical protein